jgi:hypothetical protein
MGSRSRKRRRPDRPVVSRPGAAPDPAPDPAPGAAPDPLRDRYARGRARDAEVREGLEPLAPGERPGAVTVAALVAFAFAIANVIAYAVGGDLSSDEGNPAFFMVTTTTILAVAGIGMLRAKYWAVLGYQVILALQVIVFSLALTRVEKWWLAIVLVAAVGLLGWLFWKLVRAMARLQMPERRPREPTR